MAVILSVILQVILENLVSIVFAIVVVSIFYLYRRFTFLKYAGVPESRNFFQNIYNLVFFKKGIADVTVSIYTQMKQTGSKFTCSFLPFPVFIPIDPELVKSIMQKDFDHFMNRGLYYNEEDDPLSAHLFAIEDTKWRNLRAKLTPTFTSGKMKMMFNTVLQTNNQMKLVLDQVEQGESFEIKDVMLRLNSDIIGSCAFGLDISSLKDPNVEFIKYSCKIFQHGFLSHMKRMFRNSFPDLARSLGMTLVNKDTSSFYLNLIKKTVAYREKEDVHRKDFMHLLIQLKNKGRISDDDTLHGTKDEQQGLTVNEIAAQSFVFFIAGFETSSSVISHTVYELALHLDIQEKVRQEVNKIIAKNGNEITYEGIMEMTYMEMVINEAVRKYPTLPILHRVVTKDYKIPDTDIVLKKGTKVFIPTKALHKDPEYYPDPEKYDPERFSDENKSKRHPFTFLPFGEGPRVCIGLRFGMLQTKVALAVLLSNYQFTLDPKTNVPLRSNPKVFFTAPIGGIWINIKKMVAC